VGRIQLRSVAGDRWAHSIRFGSAGVMHSPRAKGVQTREGRRGGGIDNFFLIRCALEMERTVARATRCHRKPHGSGASSRL